MLEKERSGQVEVIELKEKEVKELVFTKNTFEAESKNLNDELYEV